jgi:hypothetical protein
VSQRPPGDEWAPREPGVGRLGRRGREFLTEPQLFLLVGVAGSSPIVVRLDTGHERVKETEGGGS